MSTAVLLEGVTKRFSGHTAVRNLSMQVPSGGIFGFLGPNGAGKSTTIRMIMEIYLADEGRIEVLGSSRGARALSDRLGYIPEERGLYKKMKVIDQLSFFGETKGISSAESRRRGLLWIDRLGLGEWREKKVEDLSKGMQQKVQFAGALLHDPELVVLDEPFSGLDPVNSQVMKDVVIDIAKQGRTVLFSTHIMEQAERMCDRVVIIAHGEKVVDGTLAEIKKEFGGTHVALTFSSEKDRASSVLRDRSFVARLDDYGATADLELATGAAPEELLRALVSSGVGLTRFELVEPSLQSIFIAKVGADAATAARKEEVAA